MNLFKFKNFSLTNMNVNSNVDLAGKSLTLDYDRNQYARAFFGTNMALELIGKDGGKDVSFYAFKNCEALYAFDLSPGLKDSEAFEMTTSSHL